MDFTSAYRFMIERVSEAVLVIQDDRFPFVNPKAAELLGYSRTELTASSLQRIVHPEDLDLVLRRSAECLCGETLQSCCTFKIVAKNGIDRWVEMKSEAFNW